MNYLDDILANTRSSNILSEQNDLGAIDIGGGAAAKLQQRIDAIRNGGGWDAAEYGITAEEQIARLVATQGDPEALAKEDEILRQRAIRRAGLDTTGGKVRVMVAGTPPWHKLGVNVALAVSSKEARTLAGLDWTVSKRTLSYAHGGAQKDQDDAYAIVRDDDGSCLGVVGSRYNPIQNDEGFGFLDDVLGAFGARYETAGSIHGGKKVWMLAGLPRSSFEVGKGDRVEAYAIFTNPHDGSGQAWCFPTSERVVCANTLRVATNGKAKGIGLRHTGDIKAKINSAQTALGLSVRGFERFKESAEVLAKKPIAELGGPRQYVDAVLDEVLEIKAVDVQIGAEAIARQRGGYVTPDDFTYCVKNAEKEIQSRGDILADILNRFESERCRVNGISGTAWAGLNAVTEHADYANGKRHVGTAQAQASRKFESILAGDADEMKQIAYRMAMA